MMESILMDPRRMRSTRQAAKSAVTVRRRNSLGEATDRQRPVTVIPKVREQAFPPIDQQRSRQLAVTSSHRGDVERERLPSIERNQFVSRGSSPALGRGSEASELREIGPVDEGRTESVVEEAETDVDSVVPTNEDKDERNEEEAAEPEEPKEDDQEEDEKPEEDKEDALPSEEPQQTSDDKVEEEKTSSSSSKPPLKRRTRRPWLMGPRAPRPTGQPDKLIRKLDKKVERDLRALQGQPTEDPDDDDDDTDVDDDTMNDILHGERGKELNDFLQRS